MYDLPKEHLTGIEFFRLSDLKPLSVEGYFKCLDQLRPLLKSSEFSKSTPGFYINHITNVDDDKGNSVRLTYYTVNPTETLKTISDFMRSNKEVAIYNSKHSSRPEAATRLSLHEDEELQFRNFLNVNTQIALELFVSCREAFPALVYSYRHFLFPSRISPELIFEPILSKYSPYFKRLKDKSLDKRYLSDLGHCYPGKSPNLHFLVNMTAVEENYTYDPRFFEKDWFLS
jgi:hypothetical protein